MANRHLIGKQILQVDIGPSENTYAIQQQLSELVWKDLTPKLSDLFDQYVDGSEVLRVDKIELELGEIDLKAPNYDSIINRILVLLKEELRQAIALNSSEVGAIKNPNSKKVRQRSHEYMFEIWLYWLEMGTLPSYALRPEENWMPKVLESLALDHRAITSLRTKLQKNPRSLQRLILQHKQVDLKSMVELYTGYAQNDLLIMIQELQDCIAHEFNKGKTRDLVKFDFRELEIKLWELIFTEVISKANKLDSLTIAKKVAMALPIQLVQKLNGLSKSKRKKYPFVVQTIESLIKEQGMEKILPGSTKEPKENNLKGGHGESKTIVDSSEKQNPKESGLDSDNKIRNDGEEHSDSSIDEEIVTMGEQQEEIDHLAETQETEMETPQFFKNAGLVLLHPFLSKFLQKLELVEEKNPPAGRAGFKDFYCQSKAVVLMHFLATGNEDIQEYDMVLPKFLCGMPANLPMDHTIKLTKNEKKEATVLLEAVVENWGALGSTTPDGLREGFLVRDGKLHKKDSGWKLLIEPKAIDILLDRLPWNLSIVKLPWMEEILKVEWR